MLVSRSHSMVAYMSKTCVKLTGSAYITDVADNSKRTRGNKVKTNYLLTDIEFDYKDVNYEIEHCWLQQVDYPSGFKPQLGELYYFEFTFYPYRDGKGRDMHGMEIHHIELY